MNRYIILFFLLFFLSGVMFARPKFSLEEQENIRIYQQASSAVVHIRGVSLNYDFFFRPFPSETGSGTGFLINTQGYILTNYHVIEGANELRVTLLDNTQWEAKVIGTDPNNDLAVIKIEAPSSKFGILQLTDSSEVVVGQKVLAIGNPIWVTTHSDHWNHQCIGSYD